MCAVCFCNHCCQKTDWACTVDSTEFAGFQSASVYSVKRNGKWFCHSCQYPVHSFRHLNQHISRMTEIFRHTAVYMYAQNVQVCTAVGTSDGAWIAMSAVKIWIHDNVVTYFKSLWIVLIDLFDDTSQFMSDNSRIGNKSVCSAESSDITSTDTCCHDLDQCFTFFTYRFVHLYASYIPWFFILNCFHFLHPPVIFTSCCHFFVHFWSQERPLSS